MESVTLISGIKKVDEFTDQKNLDANTVSFMENLVLDNYGGKAYKRNGFSLYGYTLPGTGYKLYDLMGGDGNNYLVASSGSTLKTSLNGSAAWTSLSGSIITPGSKVKILPYHDKHIVTDKDTHIFVTDLATVWHFGITAPDVSSVVSEHLPGGSLSPSAQYRYCLTYNSEDGEASTPSTFFTHYVTVGSNNSTNASNTTIRIRNLPVSSDTRVVSRSLWRTQGNGNVFYLLTVLDNIATQYNDTAGDNLLDLSQQLQFLSVPTSAKNILIHKERLFLGNFTTPNLILQPTLSKVGTNGVSITAVPWTNLGEGALTTGTYSYRILWRDKSGRMSYNFEIDGVVLSGTQNSVTLNNLPIPPYGDLEGVIFRAKPASDPTYYYCGSFLGNQYDDYGVTGTETNYGPSGGSSTYKSSIAFSEIGLPNQVSFLNPNNPLQDYLINVQANDGDEITGLVDYIDRIIIFKKNSIFQLLTTGAPENWSIDLISQEVGCDQPESIVKTTDNIYFVYGGQVYKFNDYMKTNFTKTPLSIEMKRSLAGLTAVNDACYSPADQWYIMIATVNSVKLMFIYDEKLSCWYRFASTSLSWECVISRRYTDRGKLVFGDANYAVVTLYDSLTDLDFNASTGAEIVPRLGSKHFIFDNSIGSIRMRILRVNYASKIGTVYHSIYDIDSSNQRYCVDVNIAVSKKVFKMPIDQMTGTITTTNKLYYQISGAGLLWFDVAVLDYRVISRGARNV